MNNTKIIGTIGPSSFHKETLRKMYVAGLNVARINFSHSNHNEAKKIFEWVQELNTEEDRSVAILGDLQGPKLRIGDVQENLSLEKGQKITITTGECLGTSSKISINYTDFAKDVKIGNKIMIDDGKLILKVLETNQLNNVLAEVIQGGMLTSKKGVNLPNTELSLPCLTEKDLADIKFALELGIEWIALSFVRSVHDIEKLRKIISKEKSAIKIVAKIEKPEAIGEIDAIIESADAIMVARGDLGVEVPIEQVPSLQKMISKKCIQKSTPVIIATQMMESMLHSLSPSRADVNDVANAVHDKVDGVMLSGETSVGDHPIEVIQTMNKIIENQEGYTNFSLEKLPPEDLKDGRYISDTICFNACTIAEQVDAKAIMTLTHSGYNAYKISSYRPPSKICIFTSNRKILNTLSLLWGVRGYYYNEFVSTDNTIADIKKIIKEKNIVKKGDYVINIASMPITDKGMTNMLKLSLIE